MRLNRLVLAGLILLAHVLPATAQNARVVPGCTLSASLPTRDAVGLMVDENGKLCTAGGGGGGGASTVAGSMEQDVRSSGTLNAATLNAAITTAINGQATVGYTFTGLTASGATLTYEQSIDGGTTWTGINAVNRGTGVPEATRTTDGQIALSATGRSTTRVRVSTIGTGTITVATNVSVREGIFSLGSPLPPGANPIGILLPPVASVSQRQITKCSVAANSATLTCTIGNGTTVSSPAGVCPATATPMVTEVRSSSSPVGLGLNGQALSTATNAITAFNPSASPAIVTCIQTLR